MMGTFYGLPHERSSILAIEPAFLAMQGMPTRAPFNRGLVGRIHIDMDIMQELAGHMHTIANKMSCLSEDPSGKR